VNAIVGTGDTPLAAEWDRLARLSQVLMLPIGKPVAPSTFGQTSIARTTAQPSALSH
jgi:hypothetical protein